MASESSLTYHSFLFYLIRIAYPECDFALFLNVHCFEQRCDRLKEVERIECLALCFLEQRVILLL
jgi:hypothetical protein